MSLLLMNTITNITIFILVLLTLTCCNTSATGAAFVLSACPTRRSMILPVVTRYRSTTIQVNLAKSHHHNDRHLHHQQHRGLNYNLNSSHSSARSFAGATNHLYFSSKNHEEPRSEDEVVEKSKRSSNEQQQQQQQQQQQEISNVHEITNKKRNSNKIKNNNIDNNDNGNENKNTNNNDIDTQNADEELMNNSLDKILQRARKRPVSITLLPYQIQAFMNTPFLSSSYISLSISPPFTITIGDTILIGVAIYLNSNGFAFGYLIGKLSVQSLRKYNLLPIFISELWTVGLAVFFRCSLEEF